MASNAELIKDIEELAIALELEVSTEGLKNDDLVALKSDLIAKQRDAENETPADAAAEAAAAKAAAKEAKKTAPPPPDGPVVANGKAITTLRGIRSEGDPITAEMLPGGADTLKDLIERGFINK